MNKNGVAGRMDAWVGKPPPLFAFAAPAARVLLFKAETQLLWLLPMRAFRRIDAAVFGTLSPLMTAGSGR